MAEPRLNAADGFARALTATPGNVALVVGEETFTYAELGAHVGKVAHAIEDARRSERPLVGILARRSLTAFAGVLGSLARGAAYVPLNPSFPIARTAKMVDASAPEIMVVGNECVDTWTELLPLIEQPTVFLFPETDSPPDLVEATPHFVVPAAEISALGQGLVVEGLPRDAMAYLLFTSGSTGDPKGVMVSHGNVTDYVREVASAYGFVEADRFTQNFELTFDLSVHDILVPLEVGASIRCPSVTDARLPAKYILDHEITVWFSVPSTVTLMSLLRSTAPGMYPSIRKSFLCGEALPLTTVRTWQEAAPNSEIVNLFGPTEATIAITGFTVGEDLTEEDCHMGVVPIGRPFEGQRTTVVDGDGAPVPKGAEGELCLGGSQVSLGYWRDEDRTRRQFVTLEGQGSDLWYRTGDLVFKDEAGELQYVGRIDNQVKILGYRVELSEIELNLRRFSGSEAVAAVAWPVKDGIAQGVEAFVARRDAGAGPTAQEIIDGCGQNLPSYMVPRTVHFLNEMPMNASGKLDKRKLVDQFLEP